MDFDISQVEGAIGKRFLDHGLLRRAFVDRTAVPQPYIDECNSRLAYNGDSVLRQTLRDILYYRRDLPLIATQQYESRLMSNRSLIEFARTQPWAPFLITGDYNWAGEAADDRAQKTMATLFEAIIGAIRLDDSFDAAAAYLRHGYLADIDTMMRLTIAPTAIQRLHEYLALRYGRQPTRSKHIIYHGQLGQEFSYEYRFRGLSGYAIAASKLEAKEKAAQSLLDQLLSAEQQTP